MSMKIGTFGSLSANFSPSQNPQTQSISGISGTLGKHGRRTRLVENPYRLHQHLQQAVLVPNDSPRESTTWYCPATKNKNLSKKYTSRGLRVGTYIIRKQPPRGSLSKMVISKYYRDWTHMARKPMKIVIAPSI